MIFPSRFIAVLLAVAAAVSCDKEQAVVPVEDGKDLIGFSVDCRDAVSTKGTAQVTLAGLRTRGFGVSAWWRKDGEFFGSVDDDHLYFLNHAVSFLSNAGTSDDWVMNPAEYWPLGSSLSFFAYAPYFDSSDPTLVFPAPDTQSMPRGRFTQKVSPSAQVDFCLAAPSLDRKADGGNVPVTFNHALTKVLLYVNVTGVPADVPNLKYRLESVRWNGLVGVNSFTFGGSTNGFRWDPLPRGDVSKRTASYVETMAAGELSDQALPAIGYHDHPATLDKYLLVNGSEKGVLYMLPQPVTSAGSVEFNLKGYTVSGGTWTPYESREPISVKLPVETVWEPGKVVAYTVTLDVTNWKEIMFDVQITAWGSNSQTFVIPVS